MFMSGFFIFLWSAVLVKSMEKTSMYVKRSELNDQQMSSSGYSFDIQNDPSSEISVQSDDIGLEILKNLGYQPSLEFQRYGEYYKPSSNIQLVKENSNRDEPVIQQYKLLPYHKVGLPSLYDGRKHQPGTSHLYPYASGFSGYYNGKQLEGLDINKGKLFDDFFKSQHGQKSDSSYNQADIFEKALNSEYDKRKIKSSNSEDGSKRNLIFDKGINSKVDYNNGAFSRGGSVDQNNSHGHFSKTSGFHNLYSKDDYDKQHTFYDRADKKGHFMKYGDLDTNHRAAEDISKEEGKSGKGYAISKSGQKGIINNGRFENHEKGFENDDGRENRHHQSRHFKENADNEEDTKSYTDHRK